MSKKETYKQFRLRILEGTYKRYLNSYWWGDDPTSQDAYFSFIGHYNVAKEAFTSLHSNPHIWVKCAVNDMYDKWSKEMDRYIGEGAV